MTLTRPLDERALYSEAARHGVTFTPGASSHSGAPLADGVPALLSAADAGGARRGRAAPGPRDPRSRAAGRATRWPRRRFPERRDSGAGSPSPHLAEPAQLVLGEVVQEAPATPPGAWPGAVEQRAAALGDRRVGAAAVAGAALPPAAACWRSRRSTRRVSPLRLSSTESASSDMRRRPSGESARYSSTSYEVRGRP